VDVLAIAAAGLWLLVFGWGAVVSSRPTLRAGAADPGPGLAPEKPALEMPALEQPALVNLAVTRCRLNGAAYPATILDLAASGYLTITEQQPGPLWCDVPASAPADAGLARSERLVLAGARALAAGDGAPFEALAESCASDVRGRWDPFERAVRAEGRRAGITRPRLSMTARILLYGGAAGVGALTFAAVQSRSSSGLWVPAAIAFFAVIVSTYWVHLLGRQDRLTVHGSALAAWSAGPSRIWPPTPRAHLARWPPPTRPRCAGWPGRLPPVPPCRSPVPPRAWLPGSGRGAGGPGPGRAFPGRSPAPPVPPRPGRRSAGNGGWCG
jgi:hypothetical protein